MRVGFFVLLVGCGAAWAGDAVMRTESWACSVPALAECDQRIGHLHGRNLLAGEGVRVAEAPEISFGKVEMLFDGSAGVLVKQGRVLPAGNPAVFTFYLGAPKRIAQVGAFTFNSDSRANQVFEVRFAQNSGHPGVQPGFSGAPDLTTGPRVLGKDTGGFHTCFRARDGGPLTKHPVDWVQFRIRPTLGTRAGQPTGKGGGRGSACLVELEVLADGSGPTWAAEETFFRNVTKFEGIIRDSYRKRATWQETFRAAREALEAQLPGSEDALSRLWDLVERDFRDEDSRRDISWEREDGIWDKPWKNNKELIARYARASRGTPAIHAEISKCSALDAARELYVRSRRIQDTMASTRPVPWEALRMAIEDLTTTFGDRYPEGPAFLKRMQEVQAELAEGPRPETILTGEDAERYVRTLREAAGFQRKALLANPLLDFDELLLVRRRANNIGLPANWQSNSSVSKTGYDNEIASLSLADRTLRTVYKPSGGEFVGDVDLHFDAGRLLFSMPAAGGDWHIHEVSLDGSGLRTVTASMASGVNNYDACYLPDGRIIFTSTAGMVAVPCVRGNSLVATLFRMNADGTGVRQLCFDQEHSWCPAVMADGRVLYTRWEYADLPHSNSRMLFTMNPDGTNQRAYYGSGSFWPNSIFYARPVPGHPTMVAGTVTGHHAPKRMGELLLFDPALGTREADGVVQRIPGHGKKVEPVIQDGLTGGSWPKFLHPCPLSEKYFLVSAKPSAQANWGVYLVDVFDNMVLLKEEDGYAMLEPIPLRKTPRPRVVPDRIDPDRDDAVVLISDIHSGPGLAGIPRGAVKRLRLYSFTYGYPGVGGLYGSIGMDGPWDMRRILGTTPVAEDGSAVVRIPANTPIAIQPLDEDGKALQIMRSWFTAMPGEVLSCVGCHEDTETVPSAAQLTNLNRAPSEIAPWHGPQRNYEFQRELQPVLDRYCVGCHDGTKDEPDLRGTVMLTGWSTKMAGNTGAGSGGKFSVAYANLHRYVRRPGIESPMPMQMPMEFHADTTELVQLLDKGHHGVELSDEAWDRLVTWIDFNAPYHGRWSTIVGESAKGKEDRRAELRKYYAKVDENHEALPEQAEEPVHAVLPEPEAPRPPALQVAGWPFDVEQARRMQAEEPVTLDLGGGVTMELVYIPPGTFAMGSVDGYADELPMRRVAIERGFWMGTTEVTNRQFGIFDPSHDSREEDRHGYQFGIPGYAVNAPGMPVVRLSWSRAAAFCEWLSAATGRKVALPTEEQWEWACRAGTDTPFFYGGLDTDFSRHANMADSTLADFSGNPYQIDRVKARYNNPENPHDNWIPQDSRFNDGGFVSEPVGRYQPNPWGLLDMHGNVAEWTASVYRPGRRVVRGGSWYDRPKRCTSSYRYGYREYQGVFNVGFRVVVE